MIHRKHGFGLAGLLTVAALGVMAFASSAQAVTGPFFFVNGSDANLHASFTASQVGVSTMLIPALNVELKCNVLETLEGLLESNEKAKAKILFKECKWFELGAPLGEIKTCHIIASATNSALHITAAGTILPAELDNGEYALLIEEISALILNETGKGCVMPTDNIFTGEICLKLDASSNHTTTLLLLSNATIQGECKAKVLNALLDPAGTKVRDTVKYGAQTATLDTHLNVSLTGLHSGLTLGVLLLP